MIRALLLSSAMLISAIPAQAQTAPPADKTDTGDVKARGDHHADVPRDIVVTAPYARNRLDVLSGTSVVTGEVLDRSLRPTIGDTLAALPGVSATSFGPNASRPILRGFQGERVRILTDGIGSIDVSNTSVDHAAVINPLTAERIEVLRGPAALLFGSSAIGGVVNVLDSRIPRKIPDEAIHLDAIGGYASASEQRFGSGVVDARVTDKIVLHIDGSYSKSGDMETGGYLLSAPLRAQARASGDADIAALADLKGKLPNSAARTWDIAGGASVITDTGSLGFSVSHYDSLYGVPVRYSLDPAVEAENVRLKLKQTRFDLRGEVQTGGGFIDRIRIRTGVADYQHSEIEDTGAVGTTFYNQGAEGRLELVQATHGGWQGAIGGQFFLRDLRIDGDEKFLPRNSTQQYGLFTLQSFDLGPFKAEAGARYERTLLNAAADADLGNPELSRNFNALSASFGVSYGLTDTIRIGLNGSRTERAPSAEELFANGPHAGTQAFEIGNPDFAIEKSWGLEGTLRGQGDGYSFAVSAYYNWFDNFIYEFQTGAVQDDLPVFQYGQASARYYGIEGEASVRLASIGGFTINADAVGDYVHASVDGGTAAPRIPPLRLLGGLEAQSDALTGRVEVERVFKQERVAAFETTTPGFTMVNASIAWKPFGAGNATSLILSGNNLFDVEARRHASFLKDYAPLSGRDIRITARFEL